MTNQIIYMTAAGLNKAKQSLDKKYKEYEDICKERTIAHELSGDGWHDNPHFNRLQQLEADKAREIAVAKATVGATRLAVIDPDNRPTEAVRLGSLVKTSVIATLSGKEQVTIWEIVGYDESDLARGQLAYNSPLGRALLGMEEGEETEVSLATGPVIVRVEALLASMNDLAPH